MPVGTRKQINLTFVSTDEVPPEKVIGLFLLDIIEMKRANFAPTYAGIDMLKIEGGIDRCFLGNRCKIVSSRRKKLIPAILTNILEKVSKKSEENGKK